MVHRLDMDTSGLMIIAKTRQVYHHLQQQFCTTKSKDLLALLEGEVKENTGTIDLPLRVDLDDRPRQLVCYEHGKPAVSWYKVIGCYKWKNPCPFFPMTGRTHQFACPCSPSFGSRLSDCRRRFVRQCRRSPAFTGHRPWIWTSGDGWEGEGLGRRF